jgi:SpoVK/Ycf46/Vps4 family AAA+-type ATPase
MTPKTNSLENPVPPKTLQLVITKLVQDGPALVNPTTIERLQLGEDLLAVLFIAPRSVTLQVAAGKVPEGEIWIPKSYNVGRPKQVAYLTAVIESLSAKKELDSADNRGDNWVLDQTPQVSFDEIAGLDEAKSKINLAIVYPWKHTEIYNYYHREPGGGFLLYGPPGSGKTMLAAAAASESGASFIHVRGSSIKDKYVGESEQRIKSLFDSAFQQERTILFIDEIDGVVNTRDEATTAHDKSLISEILDRMDGVDKKGQERRVLYIFATNRPWDVDLALLSRLSDGGIFVPQPDTDSRRHILESELGKGYPIDHSSFSIDTLALKTEGFSGREIKYLCQAATTIPLLEEIEDWRPRRSVTPADFEVVIAKAHSVLGPWYKRALEELGKKGEEERQLYGDLIDAGQEYLKNHTPATSYY